MVIGVSTHVGVRGRFSPALSYRWLSSCLRHSASGSWPFLPIRPVACCPGTMQEIKERYSKALWLSETNKLRLKKNAHRELQYVDSKIGKEAVELGSVKNGINILSNHRPDIIHQVPTHTVRCIGSSSSMNESAVDNKHQQSVRPESRFTFQRPQLERPILNLQPPQYDRAAEVVNDVSGRTMHSEKCFINGQHIKTSTTGPPAKDLPKVVHQEKTTDVYDKVIIVDNVSIAKEVAQLLITKYKDFIHACDTEVANINVKSDSPVGHGKVICISIYSGPQADFGNGKSCGWVDFPDGEVEVVMEFAPFVQDPSIKKGATLPRIGDSIQSKISILMASGMTYIFLWDF